MTFVSASVPSLHGIPFALEGDAAALRVARKIVRDLGAEAFSISKNKKSAYHAWGGFTSPLLDRTAGHGEKVAHAAGLSSAEARRRCSRLCGRLWRTTRSWVRPGAFSGPIVRGDAEVVRKHLKELGKIPEAKEVYLALARAGLRYLPLRNRKELEKQLKR